MDYSVTDYVVVYTNEVKQIDFIEEICGVNVYYMKDNTSYGETQILRCANDEEISQFLIISVKNMSYETFKSNFDIDKCVDSMSKWIENNLKYFK